MYVKTHAVFISVISVILHVKVPHACVSGAWEPQAITSQLNVPICNCFIHSSTHLFTYLCPSLLLFNMFSSRVFQPVFSKKRKKNCFLKRNGFGIYLGLCDPKQSTRPLVLFLRGRVRCSFCSVQTCTILVKTTWICSTSFIQQDESIMWSEMKSW